MKGFNRKHVRLWAYALPLATSLLLLPAKTVYGQECPLIPPECQAEANNCKSDDNEQLWSCMNSADGFDDQVACGNASRERLDICKAKLDGCRERENRTGCE